MCNTTTNPWNQSEARDKNLLLDLCKKVSTSTKPISFIGEFRKQDMAKAKTFDPEKLGEAKAGCLATLASFAAQHQNQLGAINFIWADIRCDVDKDINEPFAYFSNPMFYQIFCIGFLKHFGEQFHNWRPSDLKLPMRLQLQEIKRADNFDQLLAICHELRGIFFASGYLFDQVLNHFRAHAGGSTIQDLITSLS